MRTDGMDTWAIRRCRVPEVLMAKSSVSVRRFFHLRGEHDMMKLPPSRSRSTHKYSFPSGKLRQGTPGTEKESIETRC